MDCLHGPSRSEKMAPRFSFDGDRTALSNTARKNFCADAGTGSVSGKGSWRRLVQTPEY